MKPISFLLLLFLIPLVGIKAQKPILLSEDSIRVGQNILPAIAVTIPEAELEKTMNAWVKELQSGTRSKVVTENGQMSIFGANVKSISPSPINIYSMLNNLDTVLKLYAVIELKKDIYIQSSSGDPDYTNAKNYLKEFAKNQYLEVVREQLNAEDKKLRALKSDLSSLENEKTRLQKSIESNNSKIVSEKDNITVQTNELNTVTAELIEQNTQLSLLETGTVKTEKENYIKGLEKRKKQASNSIESSNNQINKATNEIEKAKDEIPKNERLQEQKVSEIDNQQGVYQTYDEKLNRIKAY